MPRIYVVLGLLCLATFSRAQGYHYDSTVLSVRQESPLPANDSGGRWLSSAIILTSHSAYRSHVQIYTYGIFDDYSGPRRDTAWKMADSAYYIADSILVKAVPNWINSTTPWKYIDSSYDWARLDFQLPAHGIVRIPLQIQARTQRGPPGDTVSHQLWAISYGDSLGTLEQSGGNFDIRCIAMYSAPYGAWQESVPKNDSGGRWLPSAVLVKSIDPAAVNLSVVLNNVMSNSSEGLRWELADSAFYLADSIVVSEWKNGSYVNFVAGSPWKYLDSVREGLYQEFHANLTFNLLPKGTVRIPIMLRGVGGGTYDTLSYDMSIGAYRPSTNGATIWTYFDLTVRCPDACSGPYVAFDGRPLSNKDHLAVVGQAPVEMQDSCLNGVNFPFTHATYKLIGEYSDRFTLPDTIFSNYPFSYPLITKLKFNGAPKSVIRDTLISTFTSCWGSITTVTPITAYSGYPDGYQVRPLLHNLMAPFLGSVQGNTAVVTNTSDFSITLRNLHVVDYGVDYQVTAPQVIAAHDSGYISVTLMDNDIYLDTLDPHRSTIITGIIAPYQQELSFQDSTFSLSVSGMIDVYSPKFLYSSPKLIHGIHPRGIIFTSSVSSIWGESKFVTVYGNDDSTREYFGVPYYDDPHFTLVVGQYIGTTGVTLPGYVDVDTGFLPPDIQALTTYSGDNYHNYYTKLHWPRQNDTITIDVVGVGNQAPPYDRVVPMGADRSISVWPNPASDMVRIANLMKPTDVIIADELGRRIARQKLQQSDIIDVSSFAPGMYQFYFPELQQSTKVQILR